MPETRLYEVNDTKAATTRLIEATNPAQAMRHIAASRFTVEVPNTLRVAELMQAGVKVEKAGEPK